MLVVPARLFLLNNMSSVFTYAALIAGAYVVKKILDGVVDPIIIGATGLGDRHGGTGGASNADARAEKRRRDSDADREESDNNGKRKLKFANDVGAYDINGKEWVVQTKDDAKVFYPTKGGEGGLVRVMRRDRSEKFIKRAFSSSPKSTSLMHFVSLKKPSIYAREHSRPFAIIG